MAGRGRILDVKGFEFNYVRPVAPFYTGSLTQFVQQLMHHFHICMLRQVPWTMHWMNLKVCMALCQVLLLKTPCC